MEQKVLPKKHTHDWEYYNCKDGETTYKCRLDGCTATKIQYHDSGCGG